ISVTQCTSAIVLSPPLAIVCGAATACVDAPAPSLRVFTGSRPAKSRGVAVTPAMLILTAVSVPKLARVRTVATRSRRHHAVDQSRRPLGLASADDRQARCPAHLR